MKTKWFLIAITLFFNSALFAQISEGGTPPSFQYSEINSLKKGIMHKEVIPLKNIEDLKIEDEQIPEIGYPKRIGTSIPSQIDLYKDGTKSQLSNGDEIIRYTIQAPNAVGLMLYYSDFYIPQGGKLFIYSQDKEQVLGAYTYNTNPTVKKYVTEAVYSDALTLEYVISKTSDETPRIKIEDVTYIYSDDIRASLRGQSLPCMIDVNCTEGANWQTQKRGVVKITMKFDDGTYVCSGSLINNTKQDKAPYILTAYHCFFSDTDTADVATSTYIFNYERDQCGIISNNKGETPLVGASLKSVSPINGGSDGTLLRLNSNIPDSYKAYYNGWDVSGTVPTSGVIIHHPNGDFKKITTYSKSPTIAGNIQFDGTIGATAPNSAWKVTYSSSITEGGSSGSSIFNQNGLIIGTLSGGSTTCEKPSLPDYYGRLYYHWDQHANPEYHFKPYLDPTNSGVKTLQGLNYDTSSIEEDLFVEKPKSIVVFPSPVSDELNVNCNDIIRELSITDMAGKQVYNIKDHDSSTIVIPVAQLPKGAYSIIVKTSEGNICSEKVIKQ